jgi:hypothetical protein
MINRPSYAQRTLELTRHSLQFVPPHLTPVVSGVLIGAVTNLALPPQDHVVAAPTTFARLVDLQRWKRKAAMPTRRASRHSGTAAHHSRTTIR